MKVDPIAALNLVENVSMKPIVVASSINIDFVAEAGHIPQPPVARPTTCAFGGPDLKTLYLTSARSTEQFSGSRFALDLEVGGLPENRFRLL